MSTTLEKVRRLVVHGELRISSHGYDQLADDGIYVRDVIASLSDAEEVEDYPDYAKGPCVLVLQQDRDGRPIHCVWGIPKALSTPAVLVTAYRPSPDRWTDDFRSRKL
jgi:hypothetical protein